MTPRRAQVLIALGTAVAIVLVVLIAVDVWGDGDGDGAADRLLVYSDSGGTDWARVKLAYCYAAVAPDPPSTSGWPGSASARAACGPPRS